MVVLPVDLAAEDLAVCRRGRRDLFSLDLDAPLDVEAVVMVFSVPAQGPGITVAFPTPLGRAGERLGAPVGQ